MVVIFERLFTLEKFELDYDNATFTAIVDGKVVEHGKVSRTTMSIVENDLIEDGHYIRYIK